MPPCGIRFAGGEGMDLATSAENSESFQKWPDLQQVVNLNQPAWMPMDAPSGSYDPQELFSKFSLTSSVALRGSL